MKALIVKELTAFGRDVRRELIADGISSRHPPSDKLFLNKLVDYGNAYLLREAKRRRNRGAIIWFDIHFGDPAVVGMTWAYNPFDTADPMTSMDFFWRIWSETDPAVGSLRSCQEAFSDYCVQHAVRA